MMPTKLWLVALLAPAAMACTHAQAKATAEMPPLEMPAPPPREVQPTGVEGPHPVPLATEPARNPPSRLRPPAPRPEPPKNAEPPKAEQPPAIEAPKPAD